MTAGTLALLAFSAAIFAGLWAGNQPSAILVRAWWSMIMFLALGAAIGWMGQIVVNEYIKKNTEAENGSEVDLEE